MPDMKDIEPADVHDRLTTALDGFIAYDTIHGRERSLDQFSIDLMKGADKLFVVCLRRNQQEKQ